MGRPMEIDDNKENSCKRLKMSLLFMAFTKFCFELKDVRGLKAAVHGALSRPP